MRRYFLDTSGLLALVNADDALHRRALTVAERLQSERRRAVTTEWVIAEFLSITARRRLRRMGTGLIERILADPATRVHPAGRRSLLAAFDLYKSHSDKEWSLVDCASILVCRSESIEEVFTSDRHFQQAGFTTLLGAR